MIDRHSHAALSNPSRAPDFDRLDAELRLTNALGPELFRKIAVDAGGGDLTEADNRWESLLAAGAWAEAALFLVEHFLPSWEVRHLGYDGGEWRCSLLPRASGLWFEYPAQAAHRLLSVAILRALLAALCIRPIRARSSVPSVAQPTIQYICCDNFA
jgi:hypothetical protein